MFKCCNIQRFFKKFEFLSTKNEDIRKGYLVSNCTHCGSLMLIECDIINNRFVHIKKYNKTAVKQFFKIKGNLTAFTRRKSSKKGSYQPCYKYGDGKNIMYFDTGNIVGSRQADLKVTKL
jgi:hypothetical protein